jgi:hypothetical protein
LQSGCDVDRLTQAKGEDLATTKGMECISS